MIHEGHLGIENSARGQRYFLHCSSNGQWYWGKYWSVRNRGQCTKRDQVGSTGKNCPWAKEVQICRKWYWFTLKTYVRMLQPNRCLYVSNPFLMEIAGVIDSENTDLIMVVKRIAPHLRNRGKHMGCSANVATWIFAVTLSLENILNPIICTSWMWSQGTTSRYFLLVSVLQ